MRVMGDVTPDELLDAYLRATEEEAEARLNVLCGTTIYPVALRVVRCKLGRYPSDVEDVVQGVVLRLSMQLRVVRAAGSCTIENVVAWTAASALNACQDFFRVVQRPRTQLSNAIRYILGHSVVFRTWKDAGRQVCGWRRCVGRDLVAPGALAKLMQNRRIEERLRLLDRTNAASIRRVLSAIVALANGPIDQGQLVTGVVSGSGLAPTLLVDVETVPQSIAGTVADESTLQRRLLAFFWQTALGLPLEQRMALLLHLTGKAGIQAFWDCEVVTREDVSAALGLTPAQLDELPWSDVMIADHIDRQRMAAQGRTWTAAASPLSPERKKRQQQWVINFRRDARRTMDRQLRGYLIGASIENIGGSSTSSERSGSFQGRAADGGQ
jgi:DNA-directed RNA polymerase specialized sigma24 family protein